jgi:hypothetical protein
VHFTQGELVLDLVQNAASAGAATVRVSWGVAGSELELIVADDGPGMPPEIVARATDPFYTDGKTHPWRSVGLGLAFLRQTAEATGGRLVLESQRREAGRARGSGADSGTRVGLYAPADHVDLPPAGDVVGTLSMVLCTEGPREIEATRRHDDASYTVRSSELIEVLGDLSSVEGRGLLREYVHSQEDELWPR